jgi:hypothetical protein
MIDVLAVRHRTFPGPAAVLLWYLAQRVRRTGLAINLEQYGTPRSQEDIDCAQATYARIASCLGARHAADAEHDEPLGLAADPTAARDEAEGRVAGLARWYVSTAERGQQRMSDELGMSPETCRRYVGYAERVLRRRFRMAGLLDEEDAI